MMSTRAMSCAPHKRIHYLRYQARAGPSRPRRLGLCRSRKARRQVAHTEARPGLRPSLLTGLQAIQDSEAANGRPPHGRNTGRTGEEAAS